MILNRLRETHDVLQRLDARDGAKRLPLMGYERVRLGYVLVLRRDGVLREVIDRTGTDGTEQVPERVLRKSTMIAANLLWDNTEYALGYGAKTPDQCRPRLAAFRQRLNDMPEVLRSDEGIGAVIAFLGDHDPERFAASRFGQQIEDLTKPVAFALDDELLLVCQRPAVVDYVGTLASEDSPEITCAVTGETDRLAVLHPSFKGVPGGSTMGASLVSFNTPSANHYGREQGANAGIGARTASAYGRALDYLLATREHRVRVGDHLIVAWADDMAARRDLIPDLINPPEEAVEDAADVRAVYRAPDLAVRPEDLDHAFYVLGLTGVNGRVAVSLWREDRLADVVDNCKAWFDDLALDGRRPQARSDGRRIKDCVRALMPASRDGRIDYDKLPGRQAAKLLEAALTRGPIPRDLAAKALLRLKVGGFPDDDHTRTALLKAYLNRSKTMDLTPGLDRSRTDIGYLLGRILAVVEHAQRRSSGGGGPNLTIRDRFWAMLSSSPARALPIVDGLFVAYAKRGRGRLVGLEIEIDQIRGLMKEVPSRLPFEQRALFGIGYSQQRTDLWRKRDLDKDGAEAGSDADADLDHEAAAAA